jgi:hypothetical protein
LKSVGEEYNVKVEDVNRQANTGIDKIEDFVNFVSDASLGGESNGTHCKGGNWLRRAEILNKIIRRNTEPGMTANEPIEREKPIKEKCL